MNDQEIVELIRNGKSSSALNSLYRNFPVIRKMILTNGGNKNDAEDIFQEALIILIRKIRDTDFKLTAQLSTYLFSVCRFIWSDELKKRNRPMPDEFIVAQSNFEQQEFADAIAVEHKAKLAERVLDELKDRCRELLILFYHQKMKLQDIAIKMGYNSENSAKNQKYKCLEAAKSKLTEMQKSSLTF
jgi:RNA polymerase sigma factor (sigma-70 family)